MHLSDIGDTFVSWIFNSGFYLVLATVPLIFVISIISMAIFLIICLECVKPKIILAGFFIFYSLLVWNYSYKESQYLLKGQEEDDEEEKSNSE